MIAIPEWLQYIILVVGLGLACFILGGVGSILHGVGSYFHAKADQIEETLTKSTPKV